jgi:hypothetical protein
MKSVFRGVLLSLCLAVAATMSAMPDATAKGFSEKFAGCCLCPRDGGGVEYCRPPMNLPPSKLAANVSILTRPLAEVHLIRMS